MDSTVIGEDMEMQVVVVTHNVLPIRSLQLQNVPRHVLHLSIFASVAASS